MESKVKISSSIGVDDYHEMKTAQICVGDEVILEITQENGIENANIDFWTKRNGMSSPVCTVAFSEFMKVMINEYERLKNLSAD